MLNLVNSSVNAMDSQDSNMSIDDKSSLQSNSNRKTIDFTKEPSVNQEEEIIQHNTDEVLSANSAVEKKNEDGVLSANSAVEKKLSSMEKIETLPREIRFKNEQRVNATSVSDIFNKIKALANVLLQYKKDLESLHESRIFTSLVNGTFDGNSMKSIKSLEADSICSDAQMEIFNDEQNNSKVGFFSKIFRKTFGQHKKSDLSTELQDKLYINKPSQDNIENISANKTSLHSADDIFHKQFINLTLRIYIVTVNDFNKTTFVLFIDTAKRFLKEYYENFVKCEEIYRMLESSPHTANTHDIRRKTASLFTTVSELADITDYFEQNNTIELFFNIIELFENKLADICAVFNVDNEARLHKYLGNDYKILCDTAKQTLNFFEKSKDIENLKIVQNTLCECFTAFNKIRLSIDTYKKSLNAFEDFMENFNSIAQYSKMFVDVLSKK